MRDHKVIYLLEDDPSIRELVQYLLAEDGFEVHAFGTVSSFRESLPTASPHLIILDIMLPDGNGIDVSVELKSYSNTKAIPILLMSADHGKVNKPTPASANSFLAKPFDISELLERVHLLTA